MKREIKFRGKTIKDGEMIVGFVVQHKPFLEIKTYIKPSDKGELHFVEVDPATVGQFTGLRDKHGVEIYEGDILRYTQHRGYLVPNLIASVIWCGNRRPWNWPIWGTDHLEHWDLFTAHELQTDVLDYLEIIGNIYENPELLEQK